MATLHITNGDSAGGTLKTFVTGHVAITADPLHEGPCPAGLEGDAWCQLRARFLAGGFGNSFEDAFRTLSAWDSAIAHADTCDEVILWFEHDLFDQLLLIRTLDLLGRLKADLPVRLSADTTYDDNTSPAADSRVGANPHDVADPSVVSGNPLPAHSGETRLSAEREGGSRTEGPRLSLICIGEFPGVERFVGLGQLTAEQLASLVDRRQPVTPQQIALAQAAWDAFRAPDPAELVRLRVRLTADTTFEFLGDALTRFMEEYPSTRNGLSRSADAILQALVAAPLTGLDLFVRTQAAERRPFMGDVTLFRIVRELASRRVPLVAIDGPAGSEPLTLDLGRKRISLTDAGHDVAAGRRDAVALNGIDEWRGGVRLQGSDRSPWRWDPAAETLVS